MMWWRSDPRRTTCAVSEGSEQPWGSTRENAPVFSQQASYPGLASFLTAKLATEQPAESQTSDGNDMETTLLYAGSSLLACTSQLW